MSVFQDILKNKTVLITEPIATTKTVAIGFWFSCGSRYETSGQRGISHFVEHLLFKRTKTRTAYDIACAFDYMGSYVNAYTDRETVCMHCVVPYNKVRNALEVFCDMTENSLFLEQDIEKERSVIESEIISSLDDPEEAALDAVAETIWKNQSISQSISGNVDDVRSLTREQLYDWYKKYFANGKLTVCIAGNINKQEIIDELEKLSTREEQCSGSETYVNNFNVPVWNSGSYFLQADFQQEQLFLLFPLPVPTSAKQQCVWSVLNALVGDTMSSRLFQRLRENGGFCYNVYSYFSLFSNCGFWCAYASSSKKNTVDVVVELYKEISSLISEGITEEELYGIKEHLCGEEMISSEDIEQHTKRLIRNYYQGFEYLNSDDVIKIIKSVTKDDIIACINEVLINESKTLVIYGPKLSRSKQKRINLEKIIR